MIRDDEPPQEEKNNKPPPPLQPLSLQLKQKEKKTKAPPLLFSSLPDEIAENILARISKWNYPNLSLVSKRFLSLLSSHELYKTRSHIGITEPCLYFCLEDLPSFPSPKWFTLWMEPADDETLADGDDILEDYSLVPVLSCPHPNPAPDFSIVAVGSDIYLIGGPYKGPPSSLVRILDCRNHTWRDGPSMLVARAGVHAFLIDEKIYVMEIDGKDDTCMEVLDIKTQIWSPLMCHGATETFRNEWFLINVFKGKIYAIAARKTYAYDPKQDTWEVVATHKCYGFIDAWCEIEDVMYCYTNSGYCMWYDSKTREWIEVKGCDFETLRKPSTFSLAHGCVIELLNHGGKLLVIWVPRGNPDMRIWCAKIALEKRHGNEVWGKIEWGNTVLTVSKSYRFLSCVVISM